MKILGINAYHGDASAAALVDGRLVAAAEEERFNRIKHAAGFPAEALRWVNAVAGTEPSGRRILAVARDPWARILRKVIHALRMPSAARDRLRVRTRFSGIAEDAARVLGVEPATVDVRRVEHHTAGSWRTLALDPLGARDDLLRYLACAVILWIAATVPAPLVVLRAAVLSGALVSLVAIAQGLMRLRSISPILARCLTEEIQRLRAEHERGRRDNSMEFFGIIMFDVWWRKYVIRRPAQAWEHL